MEQTTCHPFARKYLPIMSRKMHVRYGGNMMSNVNVSGNLQSTVALVFLSVFEVIGVFGCSRSTPSATCVPGATEECACIGGRNGAQTCLHDGTFGPCQCEDLGTSAQEPQKVESAATPSIAAPQLPVPSSSQWVPLERPWARLYLYPACDGEAYGHLSTQPSTIWRTPVGVTVQVSVNTRVSTPGDVIERTPEDTDVHLVGVWPGAAGPTTFATYQYSELSCGEAQAIVVYAGQRVDGLLLVSFEHLPGRENNDFEGTTHRYIFGWNEQRAEPTILQQWRGATMRTPQLFRMRAPRVQ